MAGATERRVTRDVEPAAVRDLLERPPRATVAFVRDGAAEMLPARVRVEGDRHLFAVRAEAAFALAGREVVLIVDDGPYWFQLRGISLRGTASSTTTSDSEGLDWYSLAPRRVLAWDYGAVREE